jgi:hypothetical protein
VIWQDLGQNWVTPTTTYNSVMFNRGSWYDFIPGWSASHGNFPEPLIFLFGVYPFFFAGPPLVIAWCMRRARARFPEMGVIRLLFVALVSSMVLDFVIEIIWLRSGTYQYSGAIPSLTLSAGHYYQFPTYELIIWGLAWVACGWLVFSVNDSGHTFVERGIDRLRVTQKQKVLLRVLALAGFLNVVCVAYNGVFGMIPLQPSWRWSSDVADRSYLRDGLCGPGTTYACPVQQIIPVPRGSHGMHVDPQGRLVTP